MAQYCIRRYLSLLALLMAFASGVSLEGYPYFYRGHHDRKYIQYVLIDVGASGLNPQELSHFSIPYTLAPQINNDGQVIFNDLWGGHVWDPVRGGSQLSFGDKPVKFHAISQTGMVLGSYVDDAGKLTWLMWPERCGKRIDPVVIPTNNPECSQVYFRSINSKGGMAGTIVFSFGDQLEAFAVAWPSTNQLQTLGPGMAWGVADNGYVVANSGWDEENRPYLWHPVGGQVVLSDSECLHKPVGEVRYVDTIMGYDGSVYGSFYYEERPGFLYTYHWHPCEGKFKIMDLFGMRVSAINACETMVGCLGDAAVVCHRGKTPLDLNHMVDVQGRSWKLLEATGINDKGQIVGYGLVNGETRIFFLDPVEPAIKFYRK